MIVLMTPDEQYVFDEFMEVCCYLDAADKFDSEQFLNPEIQDRQIAKALECDGFWIGSFDNEPVVILVRHKLQELVELCNKRRRLGA